MEIDPRSKTPAYQQLAAQLRQGIKDGTWAPDTAIPSAVRLQQETGLAIMTIRHAIRVLADEGLVVTVPGRGTFVNPPELWADSQAPRQP